MNPVDSLTANYLRALLAVPRCQRGDTGALVRLLMDHWRAL